jgi:hypothetical protein
MTTTKKMRKTRRNRSVKKRGGGWFWSPKVEPETNNTDNDDTKCMLLKDYLELLEKEKENFTYPYFQLPNNQERNGNKYISFSICEAKSINKTEVKQLITTKLEYTLEYTQISYTTYKDEDGNEQNQKQKFTRIIDSNKDIYKEQIRVYKTQPTDIQSEQTNPCVISGGRTKRRRIRRKHRRKNSVRK